MVQFFDYDRLKSGINIRYRRDGDLFKPLGSIGTKKLKEFFIDSKIPRHFRDQIPLISKDKEIMWIIGHKISDKFKVTENTKTILKLSFKRRQTWIINPVYFITGCDRIKGMNFNGCKARAFKMN